MPELTLKIHGMSCEHCVRAVRSALETLPGVRVRSVELGSAEIDLSGDADLDQVRAAIEEEGYQVIEAPTSV